MAALSRLVSPAAARATHDVAVGTASFGPSARSSTGSTRSAASCRPKALTAATRSRVRSPWRPQSRKCSVSAPGSRRSTGSGSAPRTSGFSTADECADLVRGAEGVLAGSFTPHCARVDPARLARGLATACERLGVKIYEQSPAEHLRPKVVQCRNGRVLADVVVRATESYTIRERAERRSFLPLYSLMIATEPLPQQTWDELGWPDGLGIGDIRHLYYYAQRTIDGRIALGGRGAPYRLTNPISPDNEQDASVYERLCETLREAFPAASQARITHHWGGSLAVPRDWCMRTTFDPKTGQGFVGAFGGHGVTAANISGRTMRDLVLNHSTDLTSLPWVGHHTRNWEPEPIRFIASRLIAKTLESADVYEERTGKPAKRARLVAPFLPPS